MIKKFKNHRISCCMDIKFDNMLDKKNQIG